MWIASAERCRAIDRRAMEEFGLPAMVLMERAGLAVFEALRDLQPEGGAIAVLCGRGNNGGDGFVVARLAIENGYRAECIIASTEEELREEARAQMLQARSQGVSMTFSDDERWEHKLQCLPCKDVLVDALLGIGVNGAVRGPVLDAIQAINRSGVPVVAVDIPSGISTDTGEELGDSVWAVRTVTFGLPKPCLFQGIGLEHSGFWTVADIGFPSELLREPTGALILDDHWVADLLPERLRGSHKGSNGHVLIVAGSKWMRGAAVLAAQAALRSGAGLVTVAGIESVVAAAVSRVPECLFLPLPEEDGVISPKAAPMLLEQADKFDAALFGPGLTSSPSVMDFLQLVWPEWHLPTCVDADALNLVSQGLELPPVPCVLTPHPGEMGRLLSCSVAEVQADRLGTVREAVAKYRQTILLKGPYSMVGSPGTPILVNPTGNPGMASAGMGDVLAGVITTLLAQDLTPIEAAGAGMFWHGESGDTCARRMGHVGYLAHDVADTLPQARAKLTSSCCEK